MVFVAGKQIKEEEIFEALWIICMVIIITVQVLYENLYRKM